jgi:serine/threonine-protein kinase RsbW/stage II sporulation protein AB (anti-sigma F factor)
MDAAGNSRDLHLQLSAEPRSVGVARHAISDFAAASGADPGAVALAVSEAVTNAILHAYTNGSGGSIDVVARRNGSHLLVTVSDDGRGMMPNPDSPGLGFGLALVASVTDELGIAESADGGTTVRMRFALTG